jgi:hypothetical protein
MDRTYRMARKKSVSTHPLRVLISDCTVMGRPPPRRAPNDVGGELLCFVSIRSVTWNL